MPVDPVPARDALAAQRKLKAATECAVDALRDLRAALDPTARAAVDEISRGPGYLELTVAHRPNCVPDVVVTLVTEGGRNRKRVVPDALRTDLL